MVVDPAGEDVTVELCPNADIVDFNVQDHENTYQIHEDKGGQRVQSEPEKRRSDSFDDFLRFWLIVGKEIDKRIEESERSATDSNDDEGETGRINLFVERHHQSHGIDECSSDNRDSNPNGQELPRFLFIPAHDERVIIAHISGENRPNC